jgi:chemotaxis protein CheX
MSSAIDGSVDLGFAAKMVETADEIATTALGFDGATMVSVSNQRPGPGNGAYVPLISDTLNLQFALMASAGTCAALAKDLLGMEQDDPLDDADIADAIGEIANIMAGGLKSRLVDADPGLKLGLPVVVCGYLFANASLEVVSAEVLIGPRPTWLVSVRHCS